MNIDSIVDPTLMCTLHTHIQSVLNSAFESAIMNLDVLEHVESTCVLGSPVSLWKRKDGKLHYYIDKKWRGGGVICNKL